MKVPFVLNVDWIVLLSGAGLLYALALAGGRRRGYRHAVARSMAFYVGLAVLAVTFVSPLDNYVRVSLLAHATQVVLMIFAAAPLIAYGAPMAVLIRILPEGLRGRLLALIRDSRLARLVSGPLVSTVIFMGLVTVTLTPAFLDEALTDRQLYLPEYMIYVVGGYFLWRSILRVEGPHRHAALTRQVAALLLLLGLVVAIGIVLVWHQVPLYSAYAALPRPWGGRGALWSQRKAGELLLLTSAALGALVPLLLRRLPRSAPDRKPGAARSFE